MGRRKEYDREKLIAAAQRVFHSRGYKGASTALLVQELGVNRNSVYTEFGSKEALFAAVVNRYQQTVVSFLFGPLEASGATLDEIECLFRLFSDTTARSRGLGCLMCNAAAELGGAVPTLQPDVESYFQRIEGAFCNALAGAMRAEQLAQDIDVVAQSRFLTSCCVGIFILTRSGAPVHTTLGAVEGALDHLQLLRERKVKDVRSKNVPARLQRDRSVPSTASGQRKTAASGISQHQFSQSRQTRNANTSKFERPKRSH